MCYYGMYHAVEAKVASVYAKVVHLHNRSGCTHFKTVHLQISVLTFI